MIIWGGEVDLAVYPRHPNDTFAYTPSRGLYLYQRP